MESPAVVDGRVLVGRHEAQLVRDLGPPTARRRQGDQVWLVVDLPILRLRLRLETIAAADSPVVVSWTASFPRGHVRLAAAARVVGLWPAVSPDASAAEVDAPLVRRALPAPDGKATHSFTAMVRGGVFTRVSVFDEAPDWF